MLWEREMAILHVQLSIVVLIVEGVDNVILRLNHYPADKSYQKTTQDANTDSVDSGPRSTTTKRFCP